MTMPTVRIALAQLNVTVGDVEANRRLIEAALYRARAWLADIVIVPELAITGYPPEDLLLKAQFIEANRQALERLKPLTRGLAALVGFVDRDQQGHLYNAAAVLARGGHVATYRKQCLPNYGVFDEKRYFTPGSQALVLEIGGVWVGVTICEDLWEEHPCQALARGGAQLILNLSASPYHAGKLKEREELFALRARRNRLAIAYCNLVGGQDELVFDGASLVLDSRGRQLARGTQFCEEMVLVDLAPSQIRRKVASPTSPRRVGVVSIPPPREPRLSRRGEMGTGVLAKREAEGTPPVRVGGSISETLRERPPLPLERARRLSPLEEVYGALTLGVRDYVRKNGFSTVVLGLSGGVDSALTACIAADALGSEHVMGVVMPSRFSSTQTQEDARRVARSLGIEVQDIPIEPAFQAYLDTLKPFFGDRLADVTEQNIQARIRGNLLMALSNKFGWLVLTTGNKSEMATGYCTLYGDMAGGFAVIKDVPKTLVYQLAKFRNQRGPGSPIPTSVLERPPTAELAPNQTDADSLPSYDVLDQILKAYVEEDRSLREILESNRVEPATVRHVLKMVDRSEYKRRQGPPGIKITPKAFGKDRRMPITNRYRQS
jgi:NAD+ synthase (glutamine-hydrolysing)